MSSVTCHISISLDGFVAGPNQSLDNPIGESGMRLHQWVLKTAGWREQHGLKDGERDADSAVVEEVAQGIGAYIMGRKMFGGGDGPWGLLDELYLHIVPVVLGADERLLEDVGDPTLEPVEVVASPAVTHIRYRVVR
jgi:dihydrofolate reductase